MSEWRVRIRKFIKAMVMFVVSMVMFVVSPLVLAICFAKNAYDDDYWPWEYLGSGK